ncbi:MAG: toxin-antitoxin system, antitoxin component [Candidatus Kapaibacteriota bacterium]
MKKHYDFRNAEKKKFYVEENQIELPIYIDFEIQDYFLKIAQKKNLTYSQMINLILTEDKNLKNYKLNNLKNTPNQLVV